MKKILVLMLSMTLILIQTVNGYSNDYTKQETVRIKTDAYGNTKSIKVEDWLKIDSKEDIKDVSSLRDIKNSEGDEEYTTKDNYLIWENGGEDIKYTGTCDKDLPVDIKITYYLDGKEIKAEDLKGKSGKVKIKFDYDNKLTKKVNNLTVHVPFICTSCLMLPSDTFSNVKVNSGKVIESSDQSIVVGIGYPSISDDLKLDNLSNDIELDDYVEVSMDAKDFELELSATIVSTIGLNEIDEVNDLEDLSKGLETLSNVSNKLYSGSNNLSKALTTYNSYLKQYFSGVNAISSSLDLLSSNLTTLTNNKASLDKQLKYVSNELDELDKALSNTDNNDLKKLISDSKGLSNEIETINNNISKLNTYINDISKYKTSIEEYNNSLKTYLDAINLDNINGYTNNIKSIIDSSNLTQEEKTNINNELNNINSSINSNKDNLQNAKDKLNDLPTLDTSNFEDIDFSKLNELINTLEKNKDILDDYTSLNDLISNLKSSVNNVSSLSNSINVISNNLSTISKNTNNLVKSNKTLSNSLDSICDGSNTLSSSLKAFSDELDNDDSLNTTIDRFKALQKAEKSYYNYSGICDDVDGSVSFIYESEEIK